EFDVRAGLRRALASVCGLGQYEMTVNGARAGTGLLTPGWTAYEKTCLYDTYDVTSLLRPGANAVGIVLGNGMYNVQPGRYVKFVSAFRPLEAIAQFRLEYDGTTDTIATDERWRAATGPITFSNVYGGEDHAARLEPPGWARPGFDDSSWTEPAVRELRAGVAAYDFGQNASMMPRLRVRGPAGSNVKMIPAELRQADGSVD